MWKIATTRDQKVVQSAHETVSEPIYINENIAEINEETIETINQAPLYF